MKNMFKDLKSLITEIPVSEIMVHDIITLKRTDTAKDAVSLMAEKSISGVIICEDEKPIGMVAEGDIIKKVLDKGKDLENVKLSTIMTRNLISIRPTMSIGKASDLMKKKHISKLPVIKDSKIVGYVTKSDLVSKLNEIYHQNRRLILLSVVVMLQFIVITILILLYLQK